MQFLAIRIFISRIKAIRFMMADRTVSFGKKALIVAGIIYLFLPIDLVPPFIPFAGVMDDIIIWVLILHYLRKELDKYWKGEKGRDLSQKYKDNKVVNDVDFEVENDEEKEDDN